MRWNGGSGRKAVAYRKGVLRYWRCFDRAAQVWKMKGDMAGAACGRLMETLAKRKAGINAIGAIGLGENMPDGNAQRPGDIIRPYYGGVEIINTDAEGRLVLMISFTTADRFAPNSYRLATLTGAIIGVARPEYAGLFSSDDKLADRLIKTGSNRRAALADTAGANRQMIDSKFADMKNTGGRFGSSITAAQLLQRFVGKTHWAPDIAGTAMSSPNRYQQELGSGGALA